MTASLAPTNFPWTNPAALKRAFETGGRSLFNGTQNMLRDLADGGMPRMVNRDTLKVGEQLASRRARSCTARTCRAARVHAEDADGAQPPAADGAAGDQPVPYVLDLAPGRSMVEYAVRTASPPSW